MAKILSPSIAFGIGLLIGTIYSDLVNKIIKGEYAYSLTNILFLTFCIMYPIYGYVPDQSTRDAEVIVSLVLAGARLIPMLSIILIGFLLTMRSIEAVYQTMSGDDVYVVRCLGLCGFLLGNFGGLNEFLSPWVSLLPISIIVVRETVSLFSKSEPERSYSRNELLLVRRRLETDLSPDLLGIRWSGRTHPFESKSVSGMRLRGA